MRYWVVFLILDFPLKDVVINGGLTWKSYYRKNSAKLETKCCGWGNGTARERTFQEAC